MNYYINLTDEKMQKCLDLNQFYQTLKLFCFVVGFLGCFFFFGAKENFKLAKLLFQIILQSENPNYRPKSMSLYCV